MLQILIFLSRFYEPLFTSVDHVNWHIEREALRMHRFENVCCYDTCGCCPFTNNDNLFLAWTHSNGDYDVTRNFVPYDYSSNGFMLGLDHACTNFGFGLLLNYERIEESGHHRWGHVSIDNLHGSIFASYAPCFFPSLLFSGSVGFGYDWFHMRRNEHLFSTSAGEMILANHGSKSKFQACEYDLFFDVEWVTHFCGCYELIPYGSIQYVHLDIDRIREHNRFSLVNLSVQSFEPDSLRSVLGFRLNRLFKMPNLVFAPEINLGWQREYFDDHRNPHVKGILPPGNPPRFVIESQAFEIPRNRLIFGVDLYAEYCKSWGLELSYDLEWNPNFQDNSIYLGLNRRF